MKEVCLLMLVLLLCPCSPALAKTPKDMLVMAGQIDEIITLDPAEIFEFSVSAAPTNSPAAGGNGWPWSPDPGTRNSAP